MLRRGYKVYGLVECRKEGFPELDAFGFVVMFCKEMRIKQTDFITRIEFEYIATEEAK